MSEKLSLFTKKFFPVREFSILEVSYHPGTQTECRKCCLCLRKINSSLLENTVSWNCCIIQGRSQDVGKVVFVYEKILPC